MSPVSAEAEPESESGTLDPPAGTEPPPESEAPAGESGQEAPPTAQDSIGIRLEALVLAQERILARLDSLQAAAPTAPPEDTASAGPANLDLEEAREEVRGLGVGIFWSLVVIIVFHVLIRILVWALEALAERSVRRRLTFKSLIPISRMLLWAIAAYLILRTVFRVDAQGILAASAALGVALGFAAQDLLKNVFGGLIVVFDQPFQVGDKISVGGTYGEVVSIGLRSTRIVTADDNLVSVPNAQVVQESVANANAGQLHCQVVTDLYLPGRVDERKAKEIAFDAAVTSRYVFLEKPIVVLVGDEFRTTFLTRVRIKAYVLDPRFEFLFQSDVTERARDGFRAAGLVPEQDWYPAVETTTPTDPDPSAAGGGLRA
ncbi:mechanosensitive ion channel domain-containing protein [Candidatus Palauibacter sp.]|uniref:mechanosensitive ion channel domain-containing protein n=1 Tax=Candidatus Palauibacter sp. TaxID=3101350 RepID=UPI003B023676